MAEGLTPQKSSENARVQISTADGKTLSKYVVRGGGVVLV
jgi:hypothetical protein